MLIDIKGFNGWLADNALKHILVYCGVLILVSSMAHLLCFVLRGVKRAAVFISSESITMRLFRAKFPHKSAKF